MVALYRRIVLAGLAALPLAPARAVPARATEDPLARYLWKSRVIVALAPSRDDRALAAQRRLVAAMGAGARERDLVLVEAIDGTPEGAALRRRFGGDAGFTAILVGKDGGAKLTSARPFGPEVLFPVIDAMPMRPGGDRAASPLSQGRRYT